MGARELQLSVVYTQRQDGLEPFPSACHHSDPETVDSIPAKKNSSPCLEGEDLAALEIL